MKKCYDCGEEIDDDDVQFDCPYCGETDMGEGFWECESCGALMDYFGDMWVCEFCDNEGITQEVTAHIVVENAYCCPECGAEMEDEGYCDECGSGDVNQGWVGEHYG